MTSDEIHRRLGEVMWNECAMSRNKQGLIDAIDKIKQIKNDFHKKLALSGKADEFNTELEKALRLEDFIEMAQLMCEDALARDESCGAHFRSEYQSDSGEAIRNDKDYSFVSLWEHGDENLLHKEQLDFEYIKPSVRSYK